MDDKLKEALFKAVAAKASKKLGSKGDTDSDETKETEGSKVELAEEILYAFEEGDATSLAKALEDFYTKCRSK